MVDPTGGISAKQRVNHPVVVYVEIKRVVRVLRIVGVAVLRLLPRNHFAGVLDQGLALGNIGHRKDALAMHT